MTRHRIVTWTRPAVRIFTILFLGLLLPFGCASTEPVGTVRWRFEGTEPAPPLRRAKIDYLPGQNEFFVERGCIRYRFEVQALEANPRRNVYLHDEWVRDGLFGTRMVTTRVLEPTPDGESVMPGSVRLSDVPREQRVPLVEPVYELVPLWDNPIRVRWQVSTAMAGGWVDDSDDDQLVLTGVCGSLDTDKVRNLYLCESELRVLEACPVESFRVLLRLELVEPDSGDVRSYTVVPLRLRLQRAAVMQVLDQIP